MKKVILVADIQAALLGQQPEPPLRDEVTPPPTRRGRPRKAMAGGAA
ncbi:hypothetical protein THI_2074 [Thiomonas arsenitoxydans]|uniref:Uncharacterized protein n=1 Tax=Thiomonas arsenitoxydans (strain DSM 22701 / CIP 110005 / 3As) TaxID=426114 RepID=D6CTW0_THIA3|nr:hypothetical protein THI_2074 [Thiomonas arsenitoxydans]